MPGPRRILRPCPLCQATLNRLGNSAFFRCPGCGKPFKLENGVIRQTRGKRGRIAGVRKAAKRSPAEGVKDAGEYERMEGWLGWEG